jgi:hypothetical protein
MANLELEGRILALCKAGCWQTRSPGQPRFTGLRLSLAALGLLVQAGAIKD